MQYPEHRKLLDLNGANRTIGDFLDWLEEKGFMLCQYDDWENLVPSFERKAKIIADFFGINEDKLEEEKRAMLASLSAQHSQESK